MTVPPSPRSEGKGVLARRTAFALSPRRNRMHDIAWLSLTQDDVPAGDEWLSATEHEAQARLFVPKRRDDWRLGRYTAKRALTAWLAARPGVAGRHADTAGAAARVAAIVERTLDVRAARDACAAACSVSPTDDATHLPPAQPLTLADTPATLLAQIEVLAAADGAPEAWRDGQRLPIALSISHSQGRSLVALGPPDVALGCDVERIEPRSAAFVADYFTPDEQAFLLTQADAEQALWATLIWSAKESALKALRQGLRLSTQAVEVRLPRAPSGAVGSDRTPPRWRALTVVVRPDGPRFAAFWRHADDAGGFIFTMVHAGGGI